jgi:hypothetical protein
MRRTKINFICLLISFCMCSYFAAAQNVSATGFMLYQKNGYLFAAGPKGEVQISTVINDTLPISINNEVYYVANNRSAIIVYNLNDASSHDLLKNAANEDYTFKDKIVNMIFSKATNKLFFSTVSNKDAHNYVTWSYDMGTKKLGSYKDGILESIDEQGMQVINFYGADYKGKYKLKNIYAADGTLMQSSVKGYGAY